MQRQHGFAQCRRNQGIGGRVSTASDPIQTRVRHEFGETRCIFWRADQIMAAMHDHGRRVGECFCSAEQSGLVREARIQEVVGLQAIFAYGAGRGF